MTPYCHYNHYNLVRKKWKKKMAGLSSHFVTPHLTFFPTWFGCVMHFCSNSIQAVGGSKSTVLLYENGSYVMIPLDRYITYTTLPELAFLTTLTHVIDCITQRKNTKLHCVTSSSCKSQHTVLILLKPNPVCLEKTFTLKLHSFRRHLFNELQQGICTAIKMALCHGFGGC